MVVALAVVVGCDSLLFGWSVVGWRYNAPTCCDSHIVMAYIVMAYMGMTYIVMAYIVMAQPAATAI